MGAGLGRVQLAAGVPFGIGNLAMPELGARVSTGAGFTTAQLRPVANAGARTLVFKVPKPGTRAGRIAPVGICLAGVGRCARQPGLRVPT